MIGELVAALDRAGLAESTTIVLWGDNGFHLGEKLHWRKFVLWEEATRVPLIVVQPGAAVRRVYEPVSLIDIFPTIADLAGFKNMPPVDGTSLAPHLKDSGPSRSSPAIMTWGKGNHSVREGPWRYTRYRDGTEELYDLLADPHEWPISHPLLRTGRCANA